MSPPYRFPWNIPSIYDLYKPFFHTSEAVSDYFYQRKTLCTPVLPEKIVVQGFSAVHQVEDSGSS